MPLPPDKAWFPAKTYGWGWGVPTRWQGWAVTVGFVVGMALGGIFVAPRNVFAYLGYVFALSGVLTWICYAKGEKPRWRWGDAEQP